jgi:hypothetical protein
MLNLVVHAVTTGLYRVKRPSRYPAKHVPGRAPELEKTLGAVYQEWRGVL